MRQKYKHQIRQIKAKVSMATSLCECVMFEDSSAEGLITKKVHFMDKSECSGKATLMDQTIIPSVSWKDLLVSNSTFDSRKAVALFGINVEDDFDMFEGDIKKSFVDGILSIEILKGFTIF